MNINMKDFLKKKDNINIIDIRSKYEYQKSHIKNAINIDYMTLKKNPEKYLKKDVNYYIYCQSGKTSKVLNNYLNLLGYKTININNGYNNYLLWK